MNRTFIELTSSIFMWKYIREEESYEKDEKIYQAHIGLAISNVIVAGVIWVALEFIRLYSQVNYLIEPFGMMFLLGCINYFILFLSTRDTYLRIREIRWETALENFKKWFANTLRESLKDAIDQYKEENDNFRKSENDYDADKEYFENKFFKRKQVDTELAAILNRFGLPQETRDMKVIKTKYRQLAKKFHPDMPDGNSNIFQQVVLDYEALKYFLRSEKAA